MRYSIAPLVLAALAAASPMPQGVTSAISPKTTAPAGCSSSYNGNFEIQVMNVTKSAKRDIVERQNSPSGTLMMTLVKGVLTDAQGRTGYIAANNQFQFDKPPQTGAIYTAGWSVCSNGSLALGGDAIFYQCLSGTFYNLYDTATAGQCSPIYIDVVGGAASSSGVATVASDGQPTASPVVSQRTDGQITGSAVASTSARPVSAISDGQPQAATSASARPVSAISDGQPQAATSVSARPVSQISDGQVQATTSAKPVAPVSQISDGQPQAPRRTTSSVVAPVSQISDGQIQAPKTSSTASPVRQASDGQIVATKSSNSTFASPTASVAAFTGAAMPTAIRGEFFGLAAGILAVALF